MAALRFDMLSRMLYVQRSRLTAEVGGNTPPIGLIAAGASAALWVALAYIWQDKGSGGGGAMVVVVVVMLKYER